MKAVREGRSLHPTEAGLLELLGVLLTESGHPDEALVYLDLAISRAPSFCAPPPGRRPGRRGEGRGRAPRVVNGLEARSGAAPGIPRTGPVLPASPFLGPGTGGPGTRRGLGSHRLPPPARRPGELPRVPAGTARPLEAVHDAAGSNRPGGVGSPRPLARLSRVHRGSQTVIPRSRHATRRRARISVAGVPTISPGDPRSVSAPSVPAGLNCSGAVAWAARFGRVPWVRDRGGPRSARRRGRGRRPR